MSNYRFSMAPNISVPRSRFKMPFNHVTTFDHGKLVPIDCFEILPGDEFKCDFSGLIRMSTPVAPIFGNIKAHVHAFFVPMRLVWEHTKEFYGENKTSAGYQTGSYSIPQMRSGRGVNVKRNSVMAYLGKPVINYSSNGAIKYSCLKERCYFLIWSEYYRAQQLQNPVLLDVSDAGLIGNITNNHGTTQNLGNNNYYIDGGCECMNVCKEFDYFTACTTSPQYGSAVTLPLGTVAPVGVLVQSTNMSAGTSVTLTQGAATVGNISPSEAYTGSSDRGKFVADLSNATAASINTIRYAFQVQKWLERANFGSRFFEMLNLHYGVTSPDARLQRPEYLGGFDFYINVDQVVATATGNDADGSSNLLGQTGAVSVTGVKNKNLFNKAFVEPGYVMVLISTTHERSYCQGIMREDSRTDRFDFYFPEFANLGDQAVLSKELYFAEGNANTENAELGYQEHWAEYRYRANRVSGEMNPTLTGGLDYWTLAEKFSSRPTLSNSFIMEDRNELTRCLLSGAGGPDYIADFFFDYTAIREMPLYTIPGLVDHFGTM